MASKLHVLSAASCKSLSATATCKPLLRSAPTSSNPLLLSAPKSTNPILLSAPKSTNPILLSAPKSTKLLALSDRRANSPMLLHDGKSTASPILQLLSAGKPSNPLLLSAGISSNAILCSDGRATCSPMFPHAGKATASLLLQVLSTGKQSNSLLSAGSLVFNYPIVSLQAAGVRGFAGRPGGYPSDGAFMCFACYNKKKRSVVFDSPEALKTHYKINHPEIPGPPCQCGASFPDGENKHGCVLRKNETLKIFQERMRRDMRRYDKKIYKCPITNCQELCPSPLALHLHHLQRH